MDAPSSELAFLDLNPPPHQGFAQQDLDFRISTSQVCGGAMFDRIEDGFLYPKRKMSAVRAWGTSSGSHTHMGSGVKRAGVDYRSGLSIPNKDHQQI